MSHIIENILRDVCLDERVGGGIFKLDEEGHMDALRDYLLKKGIAKEAVLHVTNRMVEGRFPERQAYNKDGILVTFPTPKHKAAAIQRKTHFEKNPAPQNSTPPQEPSRGEPNPTPAPKGNDVPPQEPEKDVPDDEGDKGSLPKSSMFKDKSDKESSQMGGLEIEPPRGDKKPEPVPMPTSPTVPVAPRTPERIAAEKEVVKQIVNTDDNALSSIEPQLSEKCLSQLNELYKYADKVGLSEAVTFLTHYVKP